VTTTVLGIEVDDHPVQVRREGSAEGPPTDWSTVNPAYAFLAREQEG
jgi:hypothetical protein